MTRPLAPVAQIDAVARVADGLEQLASDLRAGQFSAPVRRVLVVLCGPDAPRCSCVGVVPLGLELSLIATLGLLEVAKQQVMQEVTT